MSYIYDENGEPQYPAPRGITVHHGTVREQGMNAPQYGYPEERPAWPPLPQQPDYTGYIPATPSRRRKRRIFLWVFLIIQLLFVVWIVTGLATVHTGATHAQLVAGCYSHNWFPLFKSQADCVTHYGGALNDAGTAGKAIGVGLIVAMWFVVDVILGVSYGVYKLATRKS